MERKNKLLRVRTVAEILCVTPRYVQSLISQGKLAAVRLTERRLWVPQEALEAYLAANSEPE